LVISIAARWRPTRTLPWLNAQIAVDTKPKLIVERQVTTKSSTWARLAKGFAKHSWVEWPDEG
jgi:hypothetical protein